MTLYNGSFFFQVHSYSFFGLSIWDDGSFGVFVCLVSSWCRENHGAFCIPKGWTLSYYQPCKIMVEKSHLLMRNKDLQLSKASSVQWTFNLLYSQEDGHMPDSNIQTISCTLRSETTLGSSLQISKMGITHAFKIQGHLRHPISLTTMVLSWIMEKAQKLLTPVAQSQFRLSEDLTHSLTSHLHLNIEARWGGEQQEVDI